MLFRKITLSTEKDTETTELPSSTPVESHPVYILGDTALAYFLAVKLTAGGHRVVVMAGQTENTSLSTNGITVKEDYQLQKLHYKLETALWLKEEPKALIIAAQSSKIKAMLTSLSKNKIKTCPVISFTRVKDHTFISDILGISVISAYFDGWLNYRSQQITAYGRNPEITLCTESSSEAYQVLSALLDGTRISLHNSSLPLQSFWNYFCLYAPCSLLTSATGKTIFDITKNKTLREELQTLLQEIVTLIPDSIPALQPEDLLKQIFNIPSNYVFPLAEQIRLHQTGDYDFISSVIREASILSKSPLPATNKLLKKLCEQIINQK